MAISSSLLTINLLPVELLAYIFILGVPDDAKDISWIKVSHVCQHWRQTALECPALWSTLNLSSYSAQWTKVMLERSQMALLTVSSDTGLSAAPKRLNVTETVLLEHLDRIGVLNISITDTVLETLFVKLISAGKKAPFLHDLSLSILYPPLGPNKAYVLDTLFPSTTSFIDPSRLERLQLANCLFTMQSPFYRNLTSLSLKGIYPHRPTMTDLLSVLASMTRIEELGLIDATPVPQKKLPIINIPTLRTLSLFDKFMIFSTGLLSQLALSHPITLFMKTTNHRGRHLLRFWNALMKHTDGEARYSKLQISHHPDNKEFFLKGDRCPDMSLIISGSDGSDHSTASSITSYLFSAFTLKYLVRLDIHDAGWNCRDTTILARGLITWNAKSEYHALWAKLDVLEQLEELHLWDSPPILLMELLLGRAMGCCGVKYGSDALMSFISDTFQFLPKLKHIGLHNIDCAWTVPSTTVSIGTFFFLDIVRAFLWARSVSGARILEMILHDCLNVSKSDLGHLKFFCDVLWDGKGELVGHCAVSEFGSLWDGEVGSYSKLVYFSLVMAHPTMPSTQEKLQNWCREYRKFFNPDLQEETDESGGSSDNDD
ncbi:hypothetical protein C8J56DRAFT_244854 [Mycena floridula]|nr:hypothetical protein C8J56DRAFT_244854 [Mycena floridula]